MRFAVQTEAAIGVYPGDFYNHRAGVRLDLVFSPHVSFGGYVGYANLKGKYGRASNVLPYAQVEYMLIAGRHPLSTPLRLRHLPRNGPVVRLSAGFAFPLTPKIDPSPSCWCRRSGSRATRCCCRHRGRAAVPALTGLEHHRALDEQVPDLGSPTRKRRPGRSIAWR
jgi:hypothetical protein